MYLKSEITISEIFELINDYWNKRITKKEFLNKFSFTKEKKIELLKKVLNKHFFKSLKIKQMIQLVQLYFLNQKQNLLIFYVDYQKKNGITNMKQQLQFFNGYIYPKQQIAYTNQQFQILKNTVGIIILHQSENAVLPWEILILLRRKKNWNYYYKVMKK